MAIILALMYIICIILCRFIVINLPPPKKKLPMAMHPKVLGLTLDPKLTYTTHIHNISVQAHKPLQIIKALTATGWSKQKETLIKSPFLKSYLHKVDAKTHPSPLCPLCNIHTHDTHHLFNCTHIRTTLSPLDLWTDPTGVTALLARWTEKLAGGTQAGTSDSPH